VTRTLESRQRDGHNTRFYEQEVRAEAFILGIIISQGSTPDELTLLSWPDFDGDLGYRVAEISATYGQGGWSIMQVDPACSQAIFAAERLVLAYYNEGKEGWPDDDVESAEWLMRYALEANKEDNDGRD
jgi:hypothetical protein